MPRQSTRIKPLSEQLRSMIDGLEIPGKMGIGVTLNSVACADYARLITLLISVIEHQDELDKIHRQYIRSMNRFLLDIAAIIALFTLMGALFNG